MAMQCPYLGLAGKRGQVLPEPSSLHRCHKAAQPERVAIGYQARVCLGQAHFRCPRLVVIEEGSRQEGEDRLKRATQRGIARLKTAAGGETGAQVTPTAVLVRPDMSERGAARAKVAAAVSVGGRRPLTVTELVVMGLGISALFTCLFVGLAILYRLQVGPGMSAAPEVASGQKGPPTLVPTFTPVPTGAPPTPVTPTSLPLETGQIATAPAAPVPTALPSRLPATSPPTRLAIPSISLDIPVLSVGTKTTRSGGQTRTVWADVPNAGGFHETSAYPGNPGNTVINGHRDILGAVFRHLDSVEVGDEITLYVGDLAYSYHVVEVLVVPEVFASASQRAENQRLIGYMPEERLTLVTCTPVALATHRLLVIAWPGYP